MKIIAPVFILSLLQTLYGSANVTTGYNPESPLENFEEQQSQFDYCLIHSNHILCEQGNSVDFLCPENVEFYPKIKKEQNEIVRILNELRAKVAFGNETRRGVKLPPASDLLQLDWDSELGMAARNIASRCQTSYLQFPFCCQCNVFSRFEVNFVHHSFHHSDLALPDWEFYFDVLKRENEDQFDPSEIRNLTQSFLLDDDYLLLIKNEVSLVGCSAGVYIAEKEGTIHNFVCVFGGITKWTGFPVYTEGSPCSNCPADSSQCSETYPTLCKCNSHCEYHPVLDVVLSSVSLNHKMQRFWHLEDPYLIPDIYQNITNENLKNYSTAFSSVDNETSSNIWRNENNLSIDDRTNSPLNEAFTDTQHCSKTKRHLLCSEFRTFTDFCPKRKTIFPQTEADRRNILRVFNEYRMRVAIGNETFVFDDNNFNLPEAANLMELQWDNELEAASRNLVGFCQFHSFDFCCECDKFDRFTANVFQLLLVNDDVLSRHWPSWDYFLAILKMNYLTSFSKMPPFNDLFPGGYSPNRFELLLSSEISLIGCSVAMYYSRNNFIHQPICVVAALSETKPVSYIEGSPCSECSNESKCSETYPGLCKCFGKCYALPKLNSFDLSLKLREFSDSSKKANLTVYKENIATTVESEINVPGREILKLPLNDSQIVKIKPRINDYDFSIVAPVITDFAYEEDQLNSDEDYAFFPIQSNSLSSTEKVNAQDVAVSKDFSIASTKNSKYTLFIVSFVALRYL